MNRPACLRHIVAHVANRRVTGYRLRTPDAEALARYIEHLEANQRGQAQAVPAPATSGMLEADGPPRLRLVDPGNPCPAKDCTLDAGHAGECVQGMTA